MAQEYDDARIEDLDEYIEVFYEDKIDLKVTASRKILLLTLDMKNIEILYNHGK
jgi:hypothetical protein